MTLPPLASDLALAREAVLAAGEAVLATFRQTEGLRYKAPGQPVTDADLEADKILHDRLLGPRPDYGWLSEESADSRARLERPRVWIVDPIDGTNSFVDGRPEFVVSVGLCEGGRPVVGVLHNPATGELYWAQAGEGAFRDGRRIRVAPPPEPGEAPIVLASRSELRRGEMDAFRDGWDIRPLGSTAYRMAKVADGTGHLFRSPGWKNEWDVCAAALLVAEAGGTVRQADGRELRFNQPEPIFRGILAACDARLAYPGSPTREPEGKEET